MNKFFMKNIVIISCMIGLLASAFSTDALANYTKRSGKGESTFKFVYSQDSMIDAQGGSSVDLKSDFGWGFTLGYNLNPHITFNYEFSSTTPSYKATLVSDDGATAVVNHKMNIYDSQFNVAYNLLDSSFTPYVQAGAGWSYVDSNIAKGPPGAVCWWDPWWGYVCNSYQNTFSDTRFSYNAAVGLRYELPNHFLLKASYRQSVIDFSHSDNASIGSYQIELGSIF